MTDAEKDAAWRSLPEVDKATYRRIYHREATAGVESYGRGYRDALADAFGKHNLTATEEPSFSKGDKVIYVGCNKDWIGSRFVIDGDIFYNDYFKCFMASSISDGDTHIGNVPLSDLAPYTEEQEPKEGNINNEAERIMLESLKISASARLAEKNIKWLSYRMELAKAIAVAYAEKGRFEPKDIAVNTMWVVDGIVERLKGGENGKVYGE